MTPLLKTKVERLLTTAVIGALLSWAWSLRTALESPVPPRWDWLLSLPAMLLLTFVGCLLVSLLWQPPKRRTADQSITPPHDR